MMTYILVLFAIAALAAEAWWGWRTLLVFLALGPPVGAALIFFAQAVQHFSSHGVPLPSVFLAMLLLSYLPGIAPAIGAALLAQLAWRLPRVGRNGWFRLLFAGACGAAAGLIAPFALMHDNAYWFMAAGAGAAMVCTALVLLLEAIDACEPSKSEEMH
ncbi:hypothetical protein CK625_10405 [Vandammella animalimorsus]|uniref:Uncharacterized protein n=1 Tax=Vandammella animalimorsus TaxID=2029117 RepID=A0A2A2ADN6_9BURK|nr:hypothetical protein CK625_10405 [Vandammella animalimorsus]